MSMEEIYKRMSERLARIADERIESMRLAEENADPRDEWTEEQIDRLARFMMDAYQRQNNGCN